MAAPSSFKSPGCSFLLYTKSTICLRPLKTSFKKAISKSLLGSLPNIFLKAKSTKGSMYFPVTGGLFFGIVKDKSLFLIHRHSECSPRRDKKSRVYKPR